MDTIEDALAESAPADQETWAAEMETTVSVFLLLCSCPRLRVVLVLIQEVAEVGNGREHRCRHRLTSTSDQIHTVL